MTACLVSELNTVTIVVIIKVVTLAVCYITMTLTVMRSNSGGVCTTTS